MSVVRSIAGFTFRVSWSEHAQDYIGTVDELPELRVYYGSADAALQGIVRRAAQEISKEGAFSDGLARAQLLHDTLKSLEQRPN